MRAPNQALARMPLTQAMAMQHQQQQQNFALQQQQSWTTSNPQQATAEAVANAPQQQPSQQNRELNAANLCRLGQETVEDIVSRTNDVFKQLSCLPLPTGKKKFNNLFKKTHFFFQFCEFI